MLGYDPYNPDFWNWDWYEKRYGTDRTEETIEELDEDNDQGLGGLAD